MRVFIVAGEASGDLHAAKLMTALRTLHPTAEFRGIGGPAMTACGLESLVDLKEMSVVGFGEIARNYRRLKRILDRTRQSLKEWKPDVFVPVDYPGFNMRLCTTARRNNIPVLWYIAPQLWAWGRHRAKKLAQLVDELLVVFPFEKDHFSRFGITTHFVGHPLLDDPRIGANTPPLEGRAHRVAFLPGSRLQEIRRHMPLFSDVVVRLRQHFPLVQCSIARSASIPAELYEQCATHKGEFEYTDDARALMCSASAGVVKTGTSTLEAALCGMPFCMVYKTSGVTYRIGRLLIKLPYISLVNILANRVVVREYIQSDASAENITSELVRLLNDHDSASVMHAAFTDIRAILGSSGASARAAQHISDFCSQHSRSRVA